MLRGLKAFKVQEENSLQGVKSSKLQKKEFKREKGLQSSETFAVQGHAQHSSLQAAEKGHLRARRRSCKQGLLLTIPRQDSLG